MRLHQLAGGFERVRVDVFGPDVTGGAHRAAPYQGDLPLPASFIGHLASRMQPETGGDFAQTPVRQFVVFGEERFDHRFGVFGGLGARGGGAGEAEINDGEGQSLVRRAGLKPRAG